jgi:hypothetical protein
MSGLGRAGPFDLSATAKAWVAPSFSLETEGADIPNWPGSGAEGAGRSTCSKRGRECGKPQPK